MASAVSDFASYLMKVDMFPVFFWAHFTIACIIVREDSKDLGPKFRQNHPFAMWFCTLMAGLAGVFVANFLFGNPLIDILKQNALIALLTAIWYLMNYSPYDVVYKVVMLPPVIIVVSVLQECLRVRFIYLGLQQASKVYPEAYIIILLGGVIKGNGYGFIRIAENLVRGKWSPGTNEILDITYFAKSGLYASVVFLLHHVQLVTVPIELLYLGIVVIFITFRLTIILAGIKDPLKPIDTPVCALLFGRGEERKPAPKSTRENDVKEKDLKEEKKTN